MTDIPFLSVRSLFNRLRKIRGFKVDKKTSAKDIRDFIKKNEGEISRELAKDKRAKGIFKSFDANKQAFRIEVEKRIQRGEIRTVERKGRVVIQSNIRWSSKEEQFLKERKFMRPKDLVASYQQTFGRYERTPKSIKDKLYKVRKLK